MTARSFTVPQTARRPMSPPGKNSGLTTKLSVVNTWPGRRAASSISRSSGSRKKRWNTRRVSSALLLPPPPWASRILSIGHPGAAAALGRDHARPQRPVGPAGLVEQRAGGRIDQAAQHVAAAAAARAAERCPPGWRSGGGRPGRRKRASAAGRWPGWRPARATRRPRARTLRPVWPCDFSLPLSRTARG